MKKLFILLIILPVSVFAQKLGVEVNNHYEMITRGSFNRIYSSYYNQVEIFYDGSSCKDLDLKSPYFDIKKDENCTFYIRAIKVAELLPVYVMKKNILVDSIIFSINRDIPLPKIQKNGKHMHSGATFTT